MHKPRPLLQHTLCDRQLPWVNKITHLGVTITNERNALETDMRIKKARYVSRNIELNQEFYFSASETKLKINEIYNSSWFGSTLYNLFGTEAERLESSYNRSVKVMLNLPFGTHRSLIEPVTGRQHLRKIFSRRFFTMIKQIRNSKKEILKVLLCEIERDVRSNTGYNLRRLLLHTDRSDISQIQLSDIDDLPYFDLPEDEEWRAEMLKHLLDMREQGPLDKEDLEWLDYLCCD